MRREIEFHDSTLVAVEPEHDVLVIRLDAYVHQWERVGESWRGTGWAQPVALRIRGARLVTPTPVPVGVSDGTLQVGSQLLDNLVPLPFSAVGPVRLTLQLVTAATLELSGDGVDLEAVGEPRYVEELPAAFRPLD